MCVCERGGGGSHYIPNNKYFIVYTLQVAEGTLEGKQSSPKVTFMDTTFANQPNINGSSTDQLDMGGLPAAEPNETSSL